MKKKGIVLGLTSIILLGFMMVSCGKPSSPVVPVPEEINLNQTGQTYEVPTDKLCVVTLEENATTGYSWNYWIDNEDILIFSSEETKATSTDKNIVGAGMIHTWKFKALKPGTTTLKFAYCRPWEAKALEAKSKMMDQPSNPRFPRLKAFEAMMMASIEKREFTITVK